MLAALVACSSGGPSRAPGPTFYVPLNTPDDPIAAEQAKCDADPLQCGTLAARYAEGREVRADRGRAVQLATRACNAGDPAGCFILGVSFAQGWGVPRDPARAAQLYLQGCDGGVMQACNNLGALYDEGLGVPRDLVRAVVYTQRACDMGDLVACTNAGANYLVGKSGPKDIARALGIFHEMCDKRASRPPARGSVRRREMDSKVPSIMHARTSCSS